MKAGIYSHNRHPENYYLLIGLAREHDSGIEWIVYVPLRVEEMWSGSARMALRYVEDFNANFTWVGERLP